MRRALIVVLLSVGLVLVPAGAALTFLVRTLDGSNNNLQHTTWGQANTQYLRVANANYADGVGTQVDGPSARYVSNRIFNDTSQNLFSENGVSQWGFVWGQFLDHTFGLRQEVGGENAPIGFSSTDPLESFTNDFGAIPFLRTPAAPGTGVTSTRQQLNTVSGYVDASAVYGDTQSRLEWMLEGPFDGRMSNSGPNLLLDDGYLPTQAERGNLDAAPAMATDGRLAFQPGHAMVAGDVRANENVALTATHTLFAREHNRIVSLLPASLSAEAKFEIARRVVGAEQQFITYREFLPALGVGLSPYRGYNPDVNAALSNEFAVVGYRAHSMIHGELEPIGEAADFKRKDLRAIEAQGVEVVREDDELEFVVPLNVAFFNPDLFRRIGIDAVMAGLGAESQYKNDEQIDNQLRSVLFQVPVPGNPDCLDGPSLPQCFRGVVDLAAIDIQRGRDHGVPLYNDLRRAYGLPAKSSFTAITGETSSALPAGMGIDDPRILEFVELRDAEGNVLAPGSEEAEDEAVTGTRRSTTAARLQALYGDVNKLDSFVGMAAEKHVAGTEFGELQLAIWKKQFETLRDGDRFFYAIDPLLPLIERQYGISYRKTLAQVIELNTDAEVTANVFLAAP
jgi:Animal haem peroxidase